MKAFEFQKVLANIPRQVAVFELVKVPDWMLTDGIKQGELFYRAANDWTLRRLSNHAGYSVGASYLSFKGYQELP
jgi:hypothetical protein